MEGRVRDQIGAFLPKRKSVSDFAAVFTTLTESMNWFENNPEADRYLDRIMELLPWVSSYNPVGKEEVVLQFHWERTSTTWRAEVPGVRKKIGSFARLEEAQFARKYVVGAMKSFRGKTRSKNKCRSTGKNKSYLYDLNDQNTRTTMNKLLKQQNEIGMYWHCVRAEAKTDFFS